MTTIRFHSYFKMVPPPLGTNKSNFDSSMESSVRFSRVGGIVHELNVVVVTCFRGLTVLLVANYAGLTAVVIG